jgi:hypothetical protein
MIYLYIESEANMKPKDKIYHFEINFDFIKNSVEQKKTEYTVIGANDTYISINNFNFTSLKHKKIYRGDTIDFNETSVYQSHFSSSWDYIRGALYTASPNDKIAYRRIKKALEKFIYEKHGRYCNAIGLLDKIII